MTDFSADVLATLGKLGRTSDEIALTLQRKGITGHRAMGESCPLAVFLSAEYPDDKIIVGPSVFLAPSRIDRSTALTSALAEFTGRFDDGEYPFLDTEEMSYL